MYCMYTTVVVVILLRCHFYCSIIYQGADFFVIRRKYFFLLYKTKNCIDVHYISSITHTLNIMLLVHSIDDTQRAKRKIFRSYHHTQYIFVKIYVSQVNQLYDAYISVDLRYLKLQPLFSALLWTIFSLNWWLRQMPILFFLCMRKEEFLMSALGFMGFRQIYLTLKLLSMVSVAMNEKWFMFTFHYIPTPHKHESMRKY